MRGCFIDLLHSTIAKYIPAAIESLAALYLLQIARRRLPFLTVTIRNIIKCDEYRLLIRITLRKHTTTTN